MSAALTIALAVVSCPLSQARGKSGPLFHFDVHDDVRMNIDANVEKDESHAGKIVTKSYYERNKVSTQAHTQHNSGRCLMLSLSPSCSHAAPSVLFPACRVGELSGQSLGDLRSDDRARWLHDQRIGSTRSVRKIDTT